MSVKVIDKVWERYPGEGNELLVALAIADWANDNGEGIYPSLATLARKSRQSESSARRHIKHMLEMGWLLRVNTGTGGRGVTSEYRINPEWLKGVSLKGFPDHGAAQAEATPSNALGTQYEGSRAPENPSTTVTGNQVGNPSNLTPFVGANPSTLEGNRPERVSNKPRKGITAMTPDPLEPKNSDARAHARRGARASADPEAPKHADPEQRRRYWRGRFLNDLQEEIWLIDLQLCRKRLAEMPSRIGQLANIEADRMLQTWGSAEPRTAAEESVTAEARAAARGILDLVRASSVEHAA